MFFSKKGYTVNSISDNGIALGSFYNAAEVSKGFAWSKELGFMDFNEFRFYRKTNP